MAQMRDSDPKLMGPSLFQGQLEEMRKINTNPVRDSSFKIA